MAIEILTLVKDLIIGLAWPAVAVAAIVIFRIPLRDLISRIRKLGPTGAEIGPHTQQPPTKRQAITEDIDKLSSQALPAVQPYLKKLHNMVEEALERQQDLAPESLLKHWVADIGGSLYLERVYRDMFASQFETITLLANRGNTAPLSDIKAIYDSATKKWPSLYPENSTFEAWVYYLTSWNLIEIRGDQVSLTAEGQAFLPYVVGQSLPVKVYG